MPAPSACPFCAPSPDTLLAASPHSIALRDRYPVTPGHALVVPRRHVASVFDLEPDEWTDLWALVRQVRTDLLADMGSTDRPDPPADGVNIGVNDGAAAGQTVAHAHVHVVPRRYGDVPDPRGGVRCVIPGKADYWSEGGSE